MHDFLFSRLAPSNIFRCTHPRHNRACVWSSLLCQALDPFRRGRNPMRPTIARALRHVQLVSMDPLPQTQLPACRPGFVSGSDPDTFGFRPGYFRVRSDGERGEVRTRQTDRRDVFGTCAPIDDGRARIAAAAARRGTSQTRERIPWERSGSGRARMAASRSLRMCGGALRRETHAKVRRT